MTQLKSSPPPQRSPTLRYEAAPAATAEVNSVEAAVAAKAEHLDAVLRKFSKGDITELKALNNPPALVKTCLEAVLILLGAPGEPTWNDIRKEMTDPTAFLTKII